MKIITNFMGIDLDYGEDTFARDWGDLPQPEIFSVGRFTPETSLISYEKKIEERFGTGVGGTVKSSGFKVVKFEP